ERVAVRRRTHDRLGGNIATGAGPVLDDEGLAQPLGQPLTHQTRNDVVRTAGGIAYDDAHWPRRIGLRPRDPRHHRQRGSAGGQLQECAARKFHDALLQSLFGTAYHALNVLRGPCPLPSSSVTTDGSVANPLSWAPVCLGLGIGCISINGNAVT